MALQIDRRSGIWVEAPRFHLRGSPRPARCLDFEAFLSQALCGLPVHQFDLLQNKWNFHYYAQISCEDLIPKNIITGKSFGINEASLPWLVALSTGSFVSLVALLPLSRSTRRDKCGVIDSGFSSLEVFPSRQWHTLRFRGHSFAVLS